MNDTLSRQSIEEVKAFLRGLSQKFENYRAVAREGNEFFLSATVREATQTISEFPCVEGEPEPPETDNVMTALVVLLGKFMPEGVDVLGEGEFTVPKLLGNEGVAELKRHVETMLNAKFQKFRPEIIRSLLTVLPA